MGRLVRLEGAVSDSEFLESMGVAPIDNPSTEVSYDNVWALNLTIEGLLRDRRRLEAMVQEYRSRVELATWFLVVAGAVIGILALVILGGNGGWVEQYMSLTSY